MCWPKVPEYKPPPTPAPAPTVMEYQADKNVLTADEDTRKKLAAMAGFQSTIKTSSQGDTSQAPTAKKTLLGG